MAKKSKTPILRFGNVMPKVYSAAGDAINNYVSFGIGTLDKIIASTNTSVGLIAFGYNNELKSGAIAVGGQLVSSKILDISTNATEEKPTPTEVTVKYLDGAEIKNFKFNSVDPEILRILDSSLSNLYQEVINNEEEFVRYKTYTDTSINQNTADISILKTQISGSDTSISELENNYVKSIVPINSSAITVNDITPTGTNGKQFEIGLNVDDTTVKIVNNKLTATGNSYTIEALGTATSGALKTYQLYQTTADGTKTPVPNSIIDIPKDYVLKEVHLCKAELYNDGGIIKYEETARQGDPDFDTAEGDIYLHFIWVTKEDGDLIYGDSSTNDSSIPGFVSETFIKVIDIAPIYKGDADGDVSTDKYITITSDYIVSMDASKLYDDMVEPLDTSIKDLYQQIEDDELVLVQYLTYADTSINQNTYDISTLKSQQGSTDTSVNNIEDTYVQNVESTSTKENIVVRNEYKPDFYLDTDSSVSAESVVDSSVTYTITKTVDGVSSVVTTITTVDTKVIDKIAELLAEDAKNIEELQNTTKWITL